MGCKTLNWYINDLSLWEQFASLADFRDSFTPLLRLRHNSAHIRRSLYASRMLGARPVIGNMSFTEAVYRGGEQIFRQSILQWLTKQGPFIDDDRQEVADDYFSFEGHDVTDQGLGEAARRLSTKQQAGTFSFLGGRVDCARDPLVVQHGLDEEPIGRFDVPNIWDVDRLERTASEQAAPPQSWAELIAQCQERFDRLLFSDNILVILRGEPFSPYVCERTIALLKVLQEYMISRLPNGSRSPRSNEIVQTHFVGDKAWFSDESAKNKREFSEEMTFTDPADSTKRIFCPWHGKIKWPQYRIHFDWPITPQTTRVRIVYIGPKITKN
jgi:hypothetical protein